MFVRVFWIEVVEDPISVDDEHPNVLSAEAVYLVVSSVSRLKEAASREVPCSVTVCGSIVEDEGLVSRDAAEADDPRKWATVLMEGEMERVHECCFVIYGSTIVVAVNLNYLHSLEITSIVRFL